MRLRRLRGRGRSASRGLSEVEEIVVWFSSRHGSRQPPSLLSPFHSHTHAEGGREEALYHLLDADGDAAMEMKLSATSAASSLALLRFLPSYQNLAWWIAPLTVTRLDQAVRPPIYFDFLVSMIWTLPLFFSAPSHFRGDEVAGGWVAP